MNQKVTSLLSILTMLLTPLALLVIALRLLLTPVFPQIEYRMPGFPADEYGFTQADRLYWSKFAITYLTNNAGIEYLGDLRFADGSQVFNERELSHMADVKKVTKSVLRIGYVDLALLVLLGLWAWRGKWDQAYRLGLRRGGWLMLVLMGTIAAFAAISFWNFFVFFHSLFFKGNSWLFYYSDTLIRLFPLRFWQDIFIAAGILVLGGSLGLALGLKPHQG
jgi:integral membrane protein (TIGR01906 family)